MAAYSLAVKTLGIFECELCGYAGQEDNALSRHHSDGDRKNNDPNNFLVVHRWRCHTFADWLTQMGIHVGYKVRPDDIIWAWRLVNTSGWLMKLVRERRT